ncbi:ribbon-helix-helix domain-containing protein [Patescibacteria group bacterium]|nr:ribbon-helix-helix domain-containing protein [Patescibacteria group bacterium]
MRSIINISLSPTLASFVDYTVKSESYQSRSEFFRSLLRSWMEDKALLDLKQSRGEIKKGKGKLLTSLKDLR